MPGSKLRVVLGGDVEIWERLKFPRVLCSIQIMKATTRFFILRLKSENPVAQATGGSHLSAREDSLLSYASGQTFESISGEMILKPRVLKLWISAL